MTDTTRPIENSSDTPAQATTSKEAITLNQTRSFIWEFLLTFSTFSVYSIFYLVVRTHEFNKLGKKRFTPWLWLFSLSPVISLFSLPVLHSALTKLETEYPSPHDKKWDLVTIVIMLLSNTYLSLSSKLPTPIWLDLLILVVWSISFAFFARRITRLKHAVPNVSWKRENKLKLVLKWLLAITLIPIYIAGTALEIIEIYQLKDVPRIETKTFTAISADQKASLKFFEQGWYQAEIGTFSDGSAEAEFASINSTNYLVLFTYSEKLASLDDHMHDRRVWLEENLSQAKCTQSRYLLEDQVSVKSDLICTERIFGEDSIAVVTVIETQKKTYELLGMYGAPEYAFDKHRQPFIQMIKEFKVE